MCLSLWLRSFFLYTVLMYIGTVLSYIRSLRLKNCLKFSAKLFELACALTALRLSSAGASRYLYSKFCAYLCRASSVAPFDLWNRSAISVRGLSVTYCLHGRVLCMCSNT